MSKRPAESWFVHVFRLLVLFCILILFHAIHQREMSRKTSTPFATLAEERIEAIFGTGCRISTETSADRLSIIDQDGSVVGSIAQTSPQSDRSVGFSGPTNVLIAFGSDDLVRHVSILSSGDTRDHIKLIENDGAFFRSFEGKTVNALASLPKVQAVTGAIPAFTASRTTQSRPKRKSSSASRSSVHTHTRLGLAPARVTA